MLWLSLVVALPIGCTVLVDSKLSGKPGAAGGGGQGGVVDSGKKLGDACVAGGECASGNCVDGVCCNNGCTGPCKACNLGVDDLGICKSHPVGTDPEGDCVEPEVCDPNSMCVSVEGVACSSDTGCASGFCRDDFCCNTSCEGTCEACSAQLTGGVDGICDGILSETDPDGECGGTTGCFAPGLCCGDAPVAPGGSCPDECDECIDGWCEIRCDDATDCPSTIACPPDWPCVVICDGDSSCKSRTIDCPADYECEVECGSSNHRCQDAQIYCKNGPCYVECLGGDACDGADVYCGSNACDAACISNGKPTLHCGNSCACPNICP
jgi:hypothetical protein